MHFTFRNVNAAFKGLVSAIHGEHLPMVRLPSRVGEVLQCTEPITVTYTHPRERVLFNQARDCNPFFHMFESLWMLAGRNDVKPLLFYNPRMADFSDDGEILHGAYGYRWRGWFGVDQLLRITKELKRDPSNRRCVLSIWSASMRYNRELNKAGLSDIYKAEDGGKDVPCNTHAYFSVTQGKRLDMTVCNRSNDLVWGMLGANVVHFSFLQEYLAACIGVDVGAYNQFTNNLHVYTERWEPDEYLKGWEHFAAVSYEKNVSPSGDSLADDPARFDEECARFVDSIDGDFEEPFLKSTAQPMMAAFRAHKQRNYRGDNNALTIAERIHADDWRTASIAWLVKRRNAWEAKSKPGQTTKGTDLG